MRILWLTNSPLPDAYKFNNMPTPQTGGWVRSASTHLLQTDQQIVLANVSLFKCNRLQMFISNEVHFYLIPHKMDKRKKDKSIDKYWTKILNDFKPDIVHIHGTEYPHSLSFIKNTHFKNTVVSIQGLVSIYHRYYFGGISKLDVLSNITLRDLIRNDSLIHQQKNLQKRGIIEKTIFKQVNYVIGRTEWDKAHSWAMKNSITYFHCNETLRDCFYYGEWNVENCERYSLFLSQGHYPIKGLHQVLRAMPLILKNYPDTKLYIAGNDFIGSSRFRINGYAKLVKKIINKYKLTKSVTFTGILDENEMKKRYLKSNIFICPSSIENSPNSLGEAQILGVPCISSFVGGVPEMIHNNVDGLLYRFEEYEMLAQKVCTLFSNRRLMENLSYNGKKHAMSRHNKNNNAQQLLSIYHKIIKQ